MQEPCTRSRVAFVVCPPAGCGQVSRRLRGERRQLGRSRVNLDLRAVCGLQVVADELVSLDASAGGAVDDDGRDLLMQRRSPALRDTGVGLVADQRVTEAPHLVAEDVGRFGLDEVPTRERHQCRVHVDVDEGLHHPGRECLPIDSRSLYDVALRLGKPVEPCRK
jgi:hypothetical protein